jgi:hypothetical protein
MSCVHQLSAALAKCETCNPSLWVCGCDAVSEPCEVGGDREEEGVSAGVDVCRMDLEHRLAARERELRALAAEKDVLSQQARAAWSLLDERTAAAHELEVCHASTHPPCIICYTKACDRCFYIVIHWTLKAPA